MSFLFATLLLVTCLLPTESYRFSDAFQSDGLFTKLRASANRVDGRRELAETFEVVYNQFDPAVCCDVSVACWDLHGCPDQALLEKLQVNPFDMEAMASRFMTTTNVDNIPCMSFLSAETALSYFPCLSGSTPQCILDTDLDFEGVCGKPKPKRDYAMELQNEGFWTEHKPAGLTRCGTDAGTEFSFFSHNGGDDVLANKKKLAIIFEGGGACWEAESCTLPIWNTMVKHSSLKKDHMVGLYDFNVNKENPMYDWNVVYIPYCTGDVFVGTNTPTYKKSDGGDMKVHHVGRHNTEAALSWVYSNHPASDIDEVIVTGCSAGSIGSQFHVGGIFKKYPNARQTYLGDSFPPLNAEKQGWERFNNWGYQWLLEDVNTALGNEKYKAEEAVINDVMFLQKMFEDTTQRIASDGTYGLIASTDDSVNAVYWNLSNGDPNRTLKEKTDSILANQGKGDEVYARTNIDVADALIPLPNVHYFMRNTTNHCITPGKDYYKKGEVKDSQGSYSADDFFKTLFNPETAKTIVDKAIIDRPIASRFRSEIRDQIGWPPSAESPAASVIPNQLMLALLPLLLCTWFTGDDFLWT